MFVLLATKDLNDGTQGFRFNFLGIKGLTRKRKTLSRGFKLQRATCMLAIHMGKRSVYIEHKPNQKTERRLHNFAG